MSRVADYFSLVRFSHSVFALPFALCGAWLAAGGVPSLRTLALVILCAVAARTAAMGFNRLVDARVDARNPRTASREIPAGRVGRGAASALVLASAAVFVGGAWGLNALAGWLALPVLAVLLGYSLMKRVHWSAHLVLGLALGLAPLGAWIAVRGAIDASVAPVVWLAAAVLSWVAGFDLVYACQDADFDRESGLHSIPARFGVARALQISALLHAGTIAALVLVGWTAGLAWGWWAALALAALLLLWEHRLVRPDDLSRVNMAFFTLNGWLGVLLFAGLALDLWMRGGRA
ncbi:MAG: UbiA family prenyltransferase [Planctomycetes bacterium]|nr:UbiA family prenyltransferase [Planctomycetota bacterium]